MLHGKGVRLFFSAQWSSRNHWMESPNERTSKDNITPALIRCRLNESNGSDQMSRADV